MYNAINQDLTILGAENQTIHCVSVGVFACPSDPDSGHPRDLPVSELADYGLPDPPGSRQTMVFASYAGCTGALLTTAIPLPGACQVDPRAIVQNDGVFHDRSPVRQADITDGLSATFLMLEKSTTSLRDLDLLGPNQSAIRGWYVTGNWGDTLASALYPPNADKTIGTTAVEAQYASASSLHPGGCNALMGDGSVHFISETIQSWVCDSGTGYPLGASRTPGGWWTNLPQPGVWQALATRAGAEVVSATSF